MANIVLLKEESQRVRVPYVPDYYREALVSRKVVWSDPCTEVSGTTKTCSDEQKPDTEAKMSGYLNSSAENYAGEKEYLLEINYLD